MTVVEMISLALAAAILIVVLGGFMNRLVLQRGLGAQFNRGMVATLTPLTVTLLALNNEIPGEAVAALIAGPIGYVLGEKYGKPDAP